MRMNLTNIWLSILTGFFLPTFATFAQAPLSCSDQSLNPEMARAIGLTITGFEGLITECKSEGCCRARNNAAHGYATGDFNELTRITAQFYDPAILVAVLGEAGLYPTGLWSFHDLQYIGQGAVDLAEKVGGLARLKALMGRQRITRKSKGYLWKCPQFAACTFIGLGIEFYDELFSDNPLITDDFIRGTVVHEIAHAIDFNLARLSYLSKPARINPIFPSSALPRGPYLSEYAITGGFQEYWPEAVSDWVYGIKYKPNAKGTYETKVREPITPQQRAIIENILIDLPLD